MKNYNYAKLEEGVLEFAPNILIDGDVQIINASQDKYTEFGWLPIERTEQPESGDNFYYTPKYTEQDGRIIQSWEQVEIPADETAEKAAAYDILMGVSE